MSAEPSKGEDMTLEQEEKLWALCEKVEAARAAFRSAQRLSLHKAELVAAADGLAAVAAEDARDYAQRVSPPWRDTIARLGDQWAEKAAVQGLDPEAFRAAYAVRAVFPASLLPAPGRLLDVLS
jgi:hypothetical protein